MDNLYLTFGRDNTSMRNEIIRSKTQSVSEILVLCNIPHCIHFRLLYSVPISLCSRYTKELFMPTRKSMRYIIMNTYPICDSPVPLRSATKMAPTEINVFICVQKPSSV